MTTLLSEIFSETEVTFVNEANLQNLHVGRLMVGRGIIFR